jgi:hypothetical protein
MALETRDILIGAAAFYVSKTTNEDTGGLPARPALTTGPASITAGTTLNTDWRNVGFTTDGVELSYEPDYGDVEVDQMLDSAVIFQQGMRVTVNTTLMEATLENLLIVWGQAGDTLDAGELSISAGELGGFPIERSLLFVGPSPRTPTGGGAGVARRERVYHIARAIQTETTAYALRRAEASSLPASFRCLPDPNATGGAAYGTITDRTIAAA